MDATEHTSQRSEWLTGIARDSHIEYLTEISQHAQYFELLSKLIDLQPGMTYLNVGCGLGQRVNPDSIQSRNVGIDISHDILRQAVALTPGSFAQAGAENLPFPSQEFDRLLAERVFEHLENPTKALSEMVRVTKSGGVLVICDPNWHTLKFSGNDAEKEIIEAVLNTGNFIKHPDIHGELPGMITTLSPTSRLTQIEKVDHLPFRVAERIFNLPLINTLARQAGITESALQLWKNNLDSDSDQTASITMMFSCIEKG